MSGIDVLRRVLARFRRAPESYYRHAPATDGCVGVSPSDARATTFSLYGAIEREAGYPLTWPRGLGDRLPGHAAYDWMVDVAGIYWWEERAYTVDHVLHLVERAIERALAADEVRYARAVFVSCNESMDPCPAGSAFELLWGMLPPVRTHVAEERAWWESRARGVGEVPPRS